MAKKRKGRWGPGAGASPGREAVERALQERIGTMLPGRRAGRYRDVPPRRPRPARGTRMPGPGPEGGLGVG